MTLDPVQRYFYGLNFENTFLRNEGMGFQNFFSAIMERVYPGDFQRVRPYGNEGDRSCDGYILSTGQFFAVYAPRAMKQRELVNKISSDFSGAIKKWDTQINEWTFVHNDKDGLPPGAVEVLEKLKNEYEPKISTMNESRLRGITLGLSLTDLEGLFGPVPTIADLHSIGFEDLRHVVQAIETAPLKYDFNAPIKAPSQKKIKKNDLSDDVTLFLATGRQREQLVARFLDNHPDPLLGERIAQEFHNLYVELRDKSTPLMTSSRNYSSMLEAWTSVLPKDPHLYLQSWRTYLSVAIFSKIPTRSRQHDPSDQAHTSKPMLDGYWG